MYQITLLHGGAGIEPIDHRTDIGRSEPLRTDQHAVTGTMFPQMDGQLPCVHIGDGAHTPAGKRIRQRNSSRGDGPFIEIADDQGPDRRESAATSRSMPPRFHSFRCAH